MQGELLHNWQNSECKVKKREKTVIQNKNTELSETYKLTHKLQGSDEAIHQ